MYWALSSHPNFYNSTLIWSLFTIMTRWTRWIFTQQTVLEQLLLRTRYFGHKARWINQNEYPEQLLNLPIWYWDACTPPCYNSQLVAMGSKDATPVDWKKWSLLEVKIWSLGEVIGNWSLFGNEKMIPLASEKWITLTVEMVVKRSLLRRGWRVENRKKGSILAVFIARLGSGKCIFFCFS